MALPAIQVPFTGVTANSPQAGPPGLHQCNDSSRPILCSSAGLSSVRSYQVAVTSFMRRTSSGLSSVRSCRVAATDRSKDPPLCSACPRRQPRRYSRSVLEKPKPSCGVGGGLVPGDSFLPVVERWMGLLKSTGSMQMTS